MARIDDHLFGYRVFSVKNEDVNTFLNSLLSLGITAKIKNSSAAIRLDEAKKLREYLKGKIDFKESEIYGIPGFFYKNRKRYATFLGLLIAFFLVIYTSGAVWEVRILGTDTANTEKITGELSALGLNTGARWSSIDRNKIETLFLSKSDDIGWLNINRRGTVAYVTVKEKTTKEDENGSGDLCTNVIAICDGIIEEITVKSGYATVKVGDAVKKGDLLISGVIPGELGGGLVKAEGIVVARVFENYKAEYNKISETKVYTEVKTSSLSYKILGFSINILKNSGNSPTSYDIIEDKSDVVLFDRYRLPITKIKSTALIYETKSLELSTDELVKLTGKSLQTTLKSALSGAELLSIKTNGGFTENGYEMHANVTALRNIATISKIERE